MFANSSDYQYLFHVHCFILKNWDWYVFLNVSHKLPTNAKQHPRKAKTSVALQQQPKIVCKGNFSSLTNASFFTTLFSSSFRKIHTRSSEYHYFFHRTTNCPCFNDFFCKASSDLQSKYNIIRTKISYIYRMQFLLLICNA